MLFSGRTGKSHDAAGYDQERRNLSRLKPIAELTNRLDMVRPGLVCLDLFPEGRDKTINGPVRHAGVVSQSGGDLFGVLHRSIHLRGAHGAFDARKGHGGEDGNDGRIQRFLSGRQEKPLVPAT